jgi:aspartate carbamoyltransferase regulatory subunit
MNIDSIKNGIVLDHITAGRGMEIYNSLELDQLDCSMRSSRMLRVTRWGRRISLRYPITLN